jgi:hypothetical protein
MSIIIPLGVQCSNATFKKKINKSTHTYPFDYMFTTPQSILKIFTFLLDENMDVEYFVRNVFFDINCLLNLKSPEHYVKDVNGFALFNENLNIILPHDINDENSINKYIRRFNRLIDTIKNNDEKIYFIYTSQSSKTNGNLTLDGIELIINVYEYLNQINKIISKYNKNYEFFIFDSILEEDKQILDSNIKWGWSIFCEDAFFVKKKHYIFYSVFVFNFLF